MNIISRKRNPKRRGGGTLHVLRQPPKHPRVDKSGDHIHRVTFVVHGEGDRDYFLQLDPHDIEEMYHVLELARTTL